MAINIKRSSRGEVLPNVVFSPRDAVWGKFYHYVKKFFHYVMLKITLKGTLKRVLSSMVEKLRKICHDGGGEE